MSYIFGVWSARSDLGDRPHWCFGSLELLRLHTRNLIALNSSIASAKTHSCKWGWLRRTSVRLSEAFPHTMNVKCSTPSLNDTKLCCKYRSMLWRLTERNVVYGYGGFMTPWFQQFCAADGELLLCLHGCVLIILNITLTPKSVDVNVSDLAVHCTSKWLLQICKLTTRSRTQHIASVLCVNKSELPVSYQTKRTLLWAIITNNLMHGGHEFD